MRGTSHIGFCMFWNELYAGGRIHFNRCEFHFIARDFPRTDRRAGVDRAVADAVVGRSRPDGSLQSHRRHRVALDKEYLSVLTNYGVVSALAR